jgi:uncharacterized membrane protein YhaH (DUF805 family)
LFQLLNLSFKGRSTRLEYWRVQVISVALGAGVFVLSLFVIKAIGPGGGALFLAFLPVVVLNIAATVRRLHDRARSGWWYLAFVVAPFMCSQAASELLAFQAPMNPVLSLPFSLASITLSLWGLVEIGFLRGRPGPNRYGDDPAMIAAVAETFA